MKKATGARVGIDEETYQKVETYMAMVSAFLKLLEVRFPKSSRFLLVLYDDGAVPVAERGRTDVWHHSRRAHARRLRPHRPACHPPLRVFGKGNWLPVRVKYLHTWLSVVSAQSLYAGW